MENRPEHHVPQPEGSNGEGSRDLHIVGRLGEKVFELSDGNFALIVDTRSEDPTSEVLGKANQELFDADAATSIADYETLGTLPRELLIETKSLIPDEPEA